MLDYYQILQVDRQADPKVIERVYKTLMFELQAHPDLGGDEEKARLINVAYHTLRDPERRRAYDAQLSAVRKAVEPLELRRPESGPEADAEPDYRTRCPRCQVEQRVPHSLPYDERLQCRACHWLFRDPEREFVALRVRLSRLGPDRSLAERLYSNALEEHRRAVEAAAAQEEQAARQALERKRKLLRMLALEVRSVQL